MKTKRAFTLLELLIVVVILGILASLGLTQYTRVIEKGRTAEAKMTLGQMRTAQEAYKLEWGNYTGTFSNLGLNLTTDTCDANHYFNYNTTNSVGTATRCLASGKPPDGTGTGYTVNITYSSGTWGGTAGYY